MLKSRRFARVRPSASVHPTTNGPGADLPDPEKRGGTTGDRSRMIDKSQPGGIKVGRLALAMADFGPHAAFSATELAATLSRFLDTHSRVTPWKQFESEEICEPVLYKAGSKASSGGRAFAWFSVFPTSRKRQRRKQKNTSRKRQRRYSGDGTGLLCPVITPRKAGPYEK
jgi:hypothetical protein